MMQMKQCFKFYSFAKISFLLICCISTEQDFADCEYLKLPLSVFCYCSISLMISNDISNRQGCCGSLYLYVFGILYLVRMQIFKNNNNNKISSRYSNERRYRPITITMTHLMNIVCKKIASTHIHWWALKEVPFL